MRLNNFIVVEGPDGVGKDTQIANIAKYYRDLHYHVKVMKPYDEEGYNYKNVIRPYIRGTTRHTISKIEFLVAIVNEMYNQMRKAKRYLNGHYNRVVIMNRYYYSTFIYNVDDEPEYNMLQGLIRYLPIPDYAIVLTADLDVCIDRIKRRRSTIDKTELKNNLKHTCDSYYRLVYWAIDNTIHLDTQLDNETIKRNVYKDLDLVFRPLCTILHLDTTYHDEDEVFNMLTEGIKYIRSAQCHRLPNHY